MLSARCSVHICAQHKVKCSYVLSARLRSSVAAFLLGNHTHLDPCWDTETKFKERIFLIEEALFKVVLLQSVNILKGKYQHFLPGILFLLNQAFP